MYARGDVHLSLASCQGIDATVEITVAGDDDDRVYSPRDLGLEDFDWVASDTRGCGEALAWRPGSEAVLCAVSPTIAFEFLDWEYVENTTAVELFTDEVREEAFAPLAVHVRTDDTKPALEAVLRYQVHCATVIAESWVGVVSPAPNCPGGDTGGNTMRYLVGSFVQVVANPVNHPDTRNFVYFETKVIPGTEALIEANPWRLHGVTNPAGWNGAKSYSGEYASAIVLVDQDVKRIAGRWQHPDGPLESFFSNTLPQVGKLFVAVTSLATGAVLGVICSPCATALAALTVSEYLLRLLPGGDFLGNIVAMLNPLNFLECTSRWGFNTLEDAPTDIAGQEELVAGIAAAKLAKSVVVRDKGALERLTTKSSKVSKLKIAGATAAFVTGLYVNGIDQFTIVDADAASLRDTAGFEQCLADTYKNPGS